MPSSALKSHRTIIARRDGIPGGSFRVYARFCRLGNVPLALTQRMWQHASPLASVTCIQAGADCLADFSAQFGPQPHLAVHNGILTTPLLLPDFPWTNLCFEIGVNARVVLTFSHAY